MISSPSRLVLDVTLTMGWRGHIVTGIPRVEAEVVEALLRRNDPSILFCSYRTKVRAFQHIPEETVRQALALPRVKPAVHRPARPQPRPRRRLWKSVEMAWRRYLFPPSNLINFKANDTYVALGAWWNTFGTDISRILPPGSDARTMVMCHDAIPALFPDFFEDRAAETRFRNALPFFSAADTVLCNSNATRQDLAKVLAAAGFPLPAMTTLRLPPGVSAAHAIPQRPPGMSDDRFVLSVGSISRRKNQAMLFEIWSRLADDPDLRNVKLIVAGGWDQYSTSIRQRLQQDPQLTKRVTILDRATDSELAWLYRHCLFTVYPSLYEGWGIPIDESLSFGKLCVASDTSAMPEAGQGLCWHLSPQDSDAWYGAIRDLLSEPSRVAAYEEKIEQAYRAATWDEVADSIIAAGRK